MAVQNTVEQNAGSICFWAQPWLDKSGDRYQQRDIMLLCLQKPLVARSRPRNRNSEKGNETKKSMRKL